MKIAILAESLDTQYAGIYTYTKNLTHSLAIVQPNIDFIWVQHEKSLESPENVSEIIIPIPRNFLTKLYQKLFLIPRLLRTQKVEAVIEPCHYGPFNLAPSTKRITVVHDLSVLKYRSKHRLISWLAHSFLLKRALKTTDLIITNSNFTKNEILKYFPNLTAEIAVTHLASNVPAAKKKITTNENSYILFVGTIEPRKNLITLLEAYKGLRDEINEPIQLVFAGKIGWKTKSFIDAYNQHLYKSDITITGYVNENKLNFLYKNAFMFIYPSLYEGFGLPLLEAMHHGLPCIASNAASLPEVGGDACLYFSPTEAGELHKKMSMIWGNEVLRQQLKIKAKQRASTFSWTRTANQTIQEIKKLFSE